MKIRYNETDQTITINDGLKTQYWLMNFVASTTIFNSILFPVFVLDEKQLAWFGVIWVIVGVVSLIVLIHQIFRKSAAEKLK